MPYGGGTTWGDASGTFGDTDSTFSDSAGALFDGVTLSIQVAFEDASLGGVEWTDITSFGRALSIRRGRQRELEKPEPGTLTLELVDTERRFDPYNTSSPYSPFVLPMRAIRVQATYGASTYDLFRGFTDSWSVSWVRPNYAIVNVAATDCMKVIANRTLDDAIFYEIFNDDPVAYFRLSEQAGTEISDEISKTKGNLVGTLTSADALTAGATNKALDFSGSSNYVLHSTAPRVTELPIVVEAWIKSTDTTSGDIVRQGSGSDSDGFVLQMTGAGNFLAVAKFEDLTYVSSTTGWNDGNAHHVAWIRTATDHRIYIDGNDQTSASGTAGADAISGMLIGGTPKTGNYFDGVIDEVALYDYDLGFARITAHALAGSAPWDGDTTGERIGRILIYLGIAGDLDTGNTVLGPALEMGGANALEYLLNIVAAENGNLWVKGDGNVNFRERHAILTESRYSTVQKTFGASTGEIDFESVTLAPADELIRNDVQVTRKNGATQRAEDETSISAYLRRTFTVSDLLLDSDAESLAFAQYLLERYKDALNRVDSVTINPRSNAASAFPAVLALDLDDRVKVVVRPTTGSAIEQESHIETLEHSITPDTWRTTYALSPADTTNFLILDSSTLGLVDTARVGY